MAMTTRVLPKAEWPRLEGQAMGAVLAHRDEDSAQVVVVEDEGLIIGQWALLGAPWIDGWWIHPERRGEVEIRKALKAGMQELMRSQSMTAAVIAVGDPRVGRLLEQLGAVRSDCTVYYWPVEE
jgi:hypothetical protein